MSYKSGKMGIAECIGFVFILTFTRIFLTLPARTISIQANLAWLSAILSGIASAVMLLLLSRAFRGHSGDLLQVTETYLGRAAKWIVGLFYAAMFFTDATLLMRQFAENTLITALQRTEFTAILLAYGLTIAIILYVGIEPICRAAYLIMPAGIFGLLLVLLMLIPFYEMESLYPWQGRGLSTLVTQAALAGGINVACLAPAILAPSFHNRKTWTDGSMLGLSISVIVKAMALLGFVLVFGASVGQERILPFYEMARLVHLGRFFQRVEALFIVLWVVCGILCIAMNLYIGLYLYTRLFQLETMRPLIPASVILMAALSSIPTDVTAVVQLESKIVLVFLNAGLYIIPGLLFIASLWRGRKKRGKAQCSAPS